MSSEQQLRATAERGRRMKEFAEGEDGLFVIFAAVEKNYVESLIGTPVDDKAIREGVYHRINALRDVRRTMELAIAEGNGASKAIEKLSSRTK